MSRKNKYRITYYGICAIVGFFFSMIGYQITTWQWWIGCGLVWSAFWCGLNCHD